jgi:hypothetical protein
MTRDQATRIEPQQPADSRGERMGCLGVLFAFVGMLGAVYACPFVIAWAAGL